jgi:hypothetical protein
MSRRRGWIVVAVVVVVLGLATIPGLIHRVFLGLGATDIHLAASLPDRLSVCGREWTKDPSGHEFSRTEIEAQSGVELVVVDPLPFAPCPPGPCTESGLNTPCDTTVFVRVGEDAYVDYALSGGP